jgi:hypothetical protein
MTLCKPTSRLIEPTLDAGPSERRSLSRLVVLASVSSRGGRGGGRRRTRPPRAQCPNVGGLRLLPALSVLLHRATHDVLGGSGSRGEECDEGGCCNRKLHDSSPGISVDAPDVGRPSPKGLFVYAKRLVKCATVLETSSSFPKFESYQAALSSL